jgi:hypothetical protein
MKAKEELSERIKIKLLAEVDNPSIEDGHMNADDALCELLIGLGFDEIVDIYDKVKKWYA